MSPTIQAIAVPAVLLGAAAVTVLVGRWAFRAGRRRLADARLALRRDLAEAEERRRPA